MRSRSLMLGLGVMLVVVVSLSSAACSSSGSSPTPSASPTPGVGGAPSKAEITAAIRELLRPEKYAAVQYITLSKLEQDAAGRWLASAYLTPPPSASSWPLNIVVAKDPDGWQIVSLKADRTGYDTSSSSPTVQPQ
jgi:hypothetical protein